MTTWTHLGNCPKFSITPKPEKLKHYSSMEGIKKLDKVAFISNECELEMHLEEFTEDNLVMALMGAAISSGEMTIGNGGPIERQIKLDGTNDFGARVEIILPHVLFSSDKIIDFIGDTWGDLQLTGDILLSSTFSPSAFGSITFLSGSAPQTPPNTNNYFIGKGNVYSSPL